MPPKDFVTNITIFHEFMNATHAYDYLPNVQTIPINDSGHWVTWEQPQVYNKHLRNWLETTVFA